MKTMMIIETVHGGMLFSLTYLAAFLIAAGIMIFQGYKKRYPLSSWLLILISGVIFFIIGDKIFTYSPAQWERILAGFGVPAAVEKNALGGIIGLFAGILSAKMILRFNRPVFDNLAIALPVAMAISRIGCLLAGCCFGIPTSLPQGIRYDAASLAYHAQLAQGLIDPHEPGSLAIHPVQLYQVAGCFVIAFIVWRTRNYWKSTGSLFLFSVLFYGFFRFFVEFLVDPASNSFTGEILWGMNLVQWVIILTFIPGFSALIIRESKGKSETMNDHPMKVTEFRQVLLVTILSIIVFGGRHWFDLIEFSTILLFFIPVVILLLAEIYRHHSVAGSRWVLPVVLIGCISIMAQKSKNTGQKDDKIIFTEAGFVGLVGKYSEALQKVTIDYDCENRYYYYQTLALQSVPCYQAGANFSYNIWRGRYNKYAIGGRLFYGEESPEQTAISTGSGPIYGISPYASLNWRWFGFTTGFSVGHMQVPLRKPEARLHDGEIISKGMIWTSFIPSLALRVGTADVFFAEGSFPPGLFPSSTPFPQYRVGIGTGFGRSDGTAAAVGYCGDAIYLRLVLPIKNKFVAEVFYAGNFSSGDRVSRIFSFGFHYRFLNTEKYKDQLKACTMQYQSISSSAHPVSKQSWKVTDIDGNVYNTVALGTQVWMATNLKVTHFNDRSEIPGITLTVKGSDVHYDWSVVSDSRKLCPAGWHVPSLAEWTSLFNFAGGNKEAAEKLEGSFSPAGQAAHWWSSTEEDADQAHSFYLNTKTTGTMFSTSEKKAGLSVRCMRDQ